MMPIKDVSMNRSPLWENWGSIPLGDPGRDLLNTAGMVPSEEGSKILIHQFSSLTEVEGHTGV